MSHTQQEFPIEWIEQTQRFTQSQHSLMLIIGKRLNDRSMLIKKITQSLRTTHPLICINSKPLTSPQSIITTLCKHWSKVTVDENDAYETQLQTILHNLKSKRQHVLIIQQAENLSLATLTTIAQLVDQQKTETKLHTILSGAPGVEGHMHKLIDSNIPQISLDTANAKRPWRQYGIRATALAGLLVITFCMNWHYHQQRRTFEKPLSDSALFAIDHQTLPTNTQTSTAPAFTALAKPKYTVTKKPINIAPTQPTHAPKTTSAPGPHAPIPKTAPAKPQPFYTLQLMSTVNKAALEHYASAHNLHQKARVYPSHYKDKQWYLLGYGHYSTIAAAHQALAHLPNDIKRLKPWVRPIV